MANVQNNLSALVEDEAEGEDMEGEEPGILSSEEDEIGEENVNAREPNKFDILCDGVVNSMALVQTAVQELLGLKDELLQHALPPAVLIKLATVCGRVFRSVSDQGKPVNELVRMVQVYSTPWEEKSAALKKLHDDYENKQRQLNIAIKRLQLVDSHSRRIAKEKRIMNWEKLFAKVTSLKGHGRRWKFLIEMIKQKAKMGYEHVQEYTRSLEESSDSESEEEEDTLVAQQSARDAVSTVASVSASENPESEVVDDTEEADVRGETMSDGSNTPMEDIMNMTSYGDKDEDEELENIESLNDTQSGTMSPKKVTFGGETPINIIKPEMTDTCSWTGEPEYDVYLYVRVFKPAGIENHELKCSLTYGDQIFKTGILDLQDEEEEVLPVTPSRPPAAGRHQGRIDRSPLNEDSAPNKYGRFEEFIVNVDNNSKDISGKNKQLQFAIQHGQYEDMLAMASVNITDLQELDLQTVYLPPVKGDDDVLRHRDDDDLDSIDSLSDSMDVPINDAASEKSAVIKNEVLKNVVPIPFPLFSLKAGKGDSGTAGSLPLIFYWGKRPQPMYFHRQSGTMGVDDLVYDLTGIDLRTTTKEDLHKESRDGACSAIQFTPEPTDETVLKSDFDAMQIKHESEMQLLQSKYEGRLQELMDNLQSMVEQQKRGKSNSPRPASVISRSTGSARSNRSIERNISTGTPGATSPVKSISVSPGDITVEHVTTPPLSKYVPVLPTKPKTVRPLPPPTRVYKNFKVGKPLPKWGENLPQDFFERLKLFEEESKSRKEELNEKTLADIKYSLEQKLASQHKLSKREEEMYDALKDVSLPALFMPYKSGNVYNPRAHQYFHPTGSTDMRLTQPPSVFQLPPLKAGDKMSVLNLFDLSRNFNRPKETWLMDKYIQQQQADQHAGVLSSERTLSGFKRSTQHSPGTNMTPDVKCGQYITERQPPDGARQEQEA